MRAVFDGVAGAVRARRATLAAFALLLVAFASFGGLSWLWAAGGLVAGVAFVAWTARRRSSGRASPLGASSRGDHDGRPSPLWRQVVDALPDPVLLLDQERTPLAANAPARALFGIGGGGLALTIHRRPELLGAVDGALRSGTTHTFELRVTTPVERHLDGTVTPLAGDPPTAVAPVLLVVLRDRTEAEQLAQMRADFVANASHELRTPLASLKGFVETLQGAARDDPAARAQFLSIMQADAARMAQLVEDLLSLSRIEMREHVPPTGRVDLAGIAREAADALRPLAEQAGITLELQPVAGAIPVVGDQAELLQVASNLAQNAIKYGRRGGHVRIAVSRERDRCSLAVSDDGMGIAAEHLPRLTERFYRVSARDSRERGGTGLGLAIVKHIVNRHGGTLAIASKVEEGSTFTVTIPAAAAGSGEKS